MNGTWKEELGGWDRKGTRRRRQSRKHLLKDKGRILNNKEKFTEEFELDFEYVDTYKQGTHVDVYKIEVSNLVGYRWSPEFQFMESVYSTNVRTAWFHNGWYDEYTNEYICPSAKTLSYLYTDFLEFEEPKKERTCWSRKWWGRQMASPQKFFYGKPVPKWKINSWYIYIGWNKESRIRNIEKGALEAKRWIKRGDWDAVQFSNKF